MNAPPVLEMRGITKRFPGILANDHVDFDLERGEVHALLGENGAGKSTLVSILYGLYHPDEGEIRLNGEPAKLSSPRDAIERGIGMVHQHFMLIPVMTVAENVVLASEPKREGVFLDYAAAEERVRRLSETYKFSLDPRAKIQNLTVGQQQRVEILKALYRGADILILDEPTAVLTPQEAAELADILRTLVEKGMSIIFISHKLNEVLEFADRITVLRRGKKIDTLPAAGATEEGLARLMVGRDVYEETGLAGAVEAPIREVTYQIVKRGQPCHKVVTYYLFRAEAGRLRPDKREGIARLRWFLMPHALERIHRDRVRDVAQHASTLLQNAPAEP